jgi:hypothetical protein
MMLEDLRKQGSQALDNLTEFILSERALVIYETTGNGDYSVARVYKVIKATSTRDSFIEMDIDTLARFCAGEDLPAGVRI